MIELCCVCSGRLLGGRAPGRRWRGEGPEPHGDAQQPAAAPPARAAPQPPFREAEKSAQQRVRFSSPFPPHAALALTLHRVFRSAFAARVWSGARGVSQGVASASRPPGPAQGGALVGSEYGSRLRLSLCGSGGVLYCDAAEGRDPTGLKDSSRRKGKKRQRHHRQRHGARLTVLGPGSRTACCRPS